MKAFYDEQKTGKRKNRHRVRIISNNFEKLIKYYETEAEAIASAYAINKFIKLKNLGK